MGDLGGFVGGRGVQDEMVGERRFDLPGFKGEIRCARLAALGLSYVATRMFWGLAIAW